MSSKGQVYLDKGASKNVIPSATEQRVESGDGSESSVCTLLAQEVIHLGNSCTLLCQTSKLWVSNPLLGKHSYESAYRCRYKNVYLNVYNSESGRQPKIDVVFLGL